MWWRSDAIHSFLTSDLFVVSFLEIMWPCYFSCAVMSFPATWASCREGCLFQSILLSTWTTTEAWGNQLTIFRVWWRSDVINSPLTSDLFAMCFYSLAWILAHTMRWTAYVTVSGTRLCWPPMILAAKEETSILRCAMLLNSSRATLVDLHLHIL